MGLLGNSFDDPQTAGILALAGNMVRGDMGGGLLGYNQAYQGTQDSLLKRQDLAQQIQLRNLQLQQAQQKWQLQEPLLRAAVTRLNGGGAPTAGASAGTPSQPATMPTPGGALGSGTVGIPTGGQPATTSSAPAQQRTMLPGVPDDVAMWNIAAGGIGSIPALLNEYNKPTDYQKMLTAGGIDTASAQGKQLIQQNLAKQNYIAPVNARPGSILRDPTNNMPVAFNPHIPDGFTPSFDANGNVVGVRPLDGALPAISSLKTAETMGTAEATPTVAYDASGRPIFSTKANDVRRAQPAATAPQSGDTDLPKIYAGELQAAKQRLAGIQADPRQTPQLLAAAQSDVDALTRLAQKYPLQATPQAAAASPSPLTPVPKLGAPQAATLSQDELSKKWSDLNGMNAQAETTKSYLDSIKQMAPKAGVGQFADKVQLANSLLSLAGSERATDEVTAKNLLDKFSQQIVSRLGGSGGLSTDAARAILQAAYPNSHMTVGAINEASDNLIGANAMIQAKARFLQGAANSRDPVTYSQREVLFDQAADPRLWQLANMDPTTAQNFLLKMPSSVRADLQRRAAILKQAGAF